MALCKNCLVPQRLCRHTFTFQIASNKSYCNAAPAIIVTWHLSSVLWAFSASTWNSTENLKMYIRTSAFPRTRKIKDLWKMPSWKRESRIMQLNTNPLANPAVNWLQLGPVPNWREFTCMGSWEKNPQMVNSSSLFIKEGGTFWKCQRRLMYSVWDPAMCCSSYCSSQEAIFLPSHIYSLSAEASSRFGNAVVVQVSLRFESIKGVL